MLPIKSVDKIIKEVFSDSVVRSVESVYEKYDKGLRLVISVHGLETEFKHNERLIIEYKKFLEAISVESTKIIHTKFIFYCNKEKTYLIEPNFSYLYDIMCEYKKVSFKEDSEEELKDALLNIVESNSFGPDIKTLSEFLDSPARHINEYLQRDQAVTDFSVYEVEYSPKFDMAPCDYITFDFKINVNNIYDMYVSIKKQKDNDYKINCRIGEELISTDAIDLINIPRKIGDALIEIMKKIQ